jgi:8-oxo-dGTP pyrophosphatase MutT (NUDIX family)
MPWTVHGRRTIYDSPWISLDLVDIEQPGGERYEQHVVRMARPVAATVMTDQAGRVLLMWRHRHVTDTWGWEIPSGRIEEGESPDQAAAREAEEETGWRPGRLRLLVASQPSNGSINTVHYIFQADGAEHMGDPADRSEAERLEWVPLADVRKLITEGEIVNGPTLIGLLLASAPPELSTSRPRAFRARRDCVRRHVDHVPGVQGQLWPRGSPRVPRAGNPVRTLYGQCRHSRSVAACQSLADGLAAPLAAVPAAPCRFPAGPMRSGRP